MSLILTDAQAKCSSFSRFTYLVCLLAGLSQHYLKCVVRGTKVRVHLLGPFEMEELGVKYLALC